MDENVRVLVGEIPEKPPRSKLEPYTDLIRELRQKRRTYEEIAQFFAEHLQLGVAPSTIHAFVKVRARRRRQMAIELPSETASSMPIAPKDSDIVATATETDARDRIDALRRRRHVEDAQRRRFEYDENEQLRLEINVKSGKRGNSSQ